MDKAQRIEIRPCRRILSYFKRVKQILCLTKLTKCSTIAIQGGGAVMAMDATCQIRMDGELKTQVEALYRDLGTSFAEAVRIFAQQSVREGRMPFRPSLKTWDELTAEEINAKLTESEADIAAGRIVSQDGLDARMKERFAHGRNQAV